MPVEKLRQYTPDLRARDDLRNGRWARKRQVISREMGELMVRLIEHCEEVEDDGRFRAWPTNEIQDRMGLPRRSVIDGSWITIGRVVEGTRGYLSVFEHAFIDCLPMKIPGQKTKQPCYFLVYDPDGLCRRAMGSYNRALAHAGSARKTLKLVDAYEINPATQEVRNAIDGGLQSMKRLPASAVNQLPPVVLEAVVHAAMNPDDIRREEETSRQPQTPAEEAAKLSEESEHLARLETALNIKLVVPPPKKP